LAGRRSLLFGLAILVAMGDGHACVLPRQLCTFGQCTIAGCDAHPSRRRRTPRHPTCTRCAVVCRGADQSCESVPVRRYVRTAERGRAPIAPVLLGVARGPLRRRCLARFFLPFEKETIHLPRLLHVGRLRQPDGGICWDVSPFLVNNNARQYCPAWPRQLQFASLSP
jgi:hypothetical protein